MTAHCAGTVTKCSSEELIEATYEPSFGQRRNSLTVTAETETCRGATYRKRNQAKTELFTNFGAETKTETEIRSTSAPRLPFFL